MSDPSQICLELAQIQGLLLTPQPEAMREVETRLANVVAGIRQRGTNQFEPGVRRSVTNIKFLLDRAKQFWDRRGTDLSPSLQYSAGGALIEHFAESTFAMEV